MFVSRITNIRHNRAKKGLKRGQKRTQTLPKNVQLGHSWAKRVKNGRKIYQSRYEVRPKRAKNGQKSAKNVSVGSVLRSEVGSKRIESRPKKIQPEKINPAKKNLNPAKKKLIPAQLGKFLWSQVGPFWPSGGLRGHLRKSKM